MPQQRTFKIKLKKNCLLNLVKMYYHLFQATSS